MQKKRSPHHSEDVTQACQDLSAHQDGNPKHRQWTASFPEKKHKGLAPLKVITHRGQMHHQFHFTVYELKIVADSFSRGQWD